MEIDVGGMFQEKLNANSFDRWKYFQAAPLPCQPQKRRKKYEKSAQQDVEKVEIFILLFLSSLVQRQAIHFYESFPSPGRGRRRKAKDRKKVSSPPKKAVAEYGAEISFSENKGKLFFATFFSQYLFSVISNVLLRVRCKAAEKNYAREFKRKGSTFYSCSRPSLSFVFPFHSILGPRVAEICFRLSILFPPLRRLQREQKKGELS